MNSRVLPFSDAVADEAAQWLTLLMSGEATAADRERWQYWRAAHADHERAWMHIEAVLGRMQSLQPGVAYKTLSPYEGPRSPQRRKALGLLLMGGIGAALTSRTDTWQKTVADHRTAVGERRDVALADGTRVALDTDSAISIDFIEARRHIRLVTGAIEITTRHDRPDPRPLTIETAEGSIRSLGTRFVVRQLDRRTRVAVIDRAVAIAPYGGGVQELAAGRQLDFTRDSFLAQRPLDAATAAWTRGQLIADDMRLHDFLAELTRYRPGVLRCDPAIADLRFSGVFPLGDTDRILALLPNSLPVRIEQRTRYWTLVAAAS